MLALWSIAYHGIWWAGGDLGGAAFGKMGWAGRPDYPSRRSNRRRSIAANGKLDFSNCLTPGVIPHMALPMGDAGVFLRRSEGGKV
jgi:hypothetical protein